MDEALPARDSLVAWLLAGALAFGSCVGLQVCESRSTGEVTPPPTSLHD